MHTKQYIKFSIENRCKYVINQEKHFRNAGIRFKIFKVENQLIDFCKELVKRKIIKSAKENGLSVVYFTHKDRKYLAVIDVLKNPEKHTTTIINLKYLFAEKSKQIEILEKQCDKNNIYEMLNYKISVKIAVRPFDRYLSTFTLHRMKVESYISNFLTMHKDWFVQRYDIEKFVISATDKLFDTLNIEMISNNKPFWIWAHERDEDENIINKFLCCFSVGVEKTNGKQFYKIILDQVEKNMINDKMKLIEKTDEKILDFEVYIKRHLPKSTNKRNRGLLIRKTLCRNVQVAGL